MSTITAFGEKLLSAILPNDRASAGCLPDCETNYYCDPYHHRYSETCCYRGDCTYFCGPLYYIDDNCPR